MDKRLFVTVILVVLAYAIPSIVGVAVTGNIGVLWSFFPMVLNFAVYAAISGIEGIDKNKLTRSIASVLIVGLVTTIMVLISHNPLTLFLTFAMFLVSIFGYII